VSVKDIFFNIFKYNLLVIILNTQNIFKIKLRIIKKDVLEIIPKLFSVNYYTFINNRIGKETKEEYVKNIISKFLELHITNPKYWDQIDLLVYWDMESYFAYEIITGIKIPLFLISEFTDDIQNIGLYHNNHKYNNLFLYNYPLITNYGYFGQINCYNINKGILLNLQYSINNLNCLVAYIENHKDADLFELKLKKKLDENQKIINSIIKQMVLMIDENQKDLDYNNLITRNIEKEADEILKKLKYRMIIKKKDI